MPKPLQWQEIKAQGTSPDPRIGHSLLKIERTIVMFGGLIMIDGRSQVQPTNDVFSLKLSNKNTQWIKHSASGDIPLPRCHHSSCEISKGQMLIFGGLYESNRRFNDTYILKIGAQMVWSQPPNQKSGQIPQNTESKIGAPEPRANHTAVYLKNINKVLIFGGHGGLGYSRKSFNDLYELDCESFEWKKIEPKGSAPEARGGHISGVMPNSDNMFIQGGWSSISQYSNMYVFEYAKNVWCEINLNFDTPRWNHQAIVVPALPQWKLFIFGGSSAFFEEGAPRNFGCVLNSVLYVDLNDKLDDGKIKKIELEDLSNLPKERENSSLIYDQSEQRLIIFGGWSNDMKNDLYELNVSAITGPEYAIYSITPNLGPLTGNTLCIINGEGFKSTSSFYVRFRNQNYQEDVSAIFVNDRQLQCRTPNFETEGPQDVDVRIWMDSGDLTITSTTFTYFYNSKANKSFAIGPGVLENNSIGKETIFYIQARDMNNENRLSGDDQFRVSITKYLENVQEETQEVKEVHEETREENEEDKKQEINQIQVEEIEYKIEDLNNGRYKVTYFYDGEPTKIKIKIELLNENNEYQLIRGGEIIATFEQGTQHDNTMSGKAMKHFIEKRLKDIEKFLGQIKKGIDMKNSNYQENRFDLLKIKETIQLLNSEKECTELDLEKINQTLKFYEEQDIHMYKEKDMVHHLEVIMMKMVKQSSDVDDLIQDNIKEESNKCRVELDNFQDKMKQFFHEMKQNDLYKYQTGVEKSNQILKVFSSELQNYEEGLNDFKYFSKMFDFPEKIQQVQNNLDMVKNEICVIQTLWSHIQNIQNVFQNYLNSNWGLLNPSEMQDEVKELFKKLKGIKGLDRKSNVSQGIIKDIQNWSQFLPIVEDLKKDAMTVPDDRHWNEFKNIIGKDFKIEEKMKLQTLWDFEIFSHKYKEKIEELTEKATQEKKIENDLNKIEEIWNGINFETVDLELKDITLKTLRMNDEDIEILDDHQLLIQGIAANKFLAYYEERVLKWQKGLANVNETIRLLSEVQKTWSFLINLFIYSEEVKKELPEDSKKFIGIDDQVRNILKEGISMSNVFKFSTNRKENKLTFVFLEEILKKLNECQKGLNDFIAKKRKVFPRFYFLTMEELLDILANGNNPVMLFKEKNYMNKIVQAGDKLEMEIIPNSRPKILSLTSSVGIEKINFINGGLILNGKVENYLQDVLQIILNTIKAKAKDSLSSLKKLERLEWIDQNFAQLNLLINSIFWVSEIEQIFKELQNGKLDAMKNFLDKSVTLLTELIKLVQGDLKKDLRTKLMCLITIDTHNRDTVEKLIKEDCRKADEFHWQSQLKFYWNQDKNDAYCRIADAQFWYEYEYLGNGARLVITPLTDRIYVTATQALHLKMGCAPAGPAGTGKTETTKDLAAAIGVACYVFNCSGEMNYQTMGNIFKGLASSGCWGCFDEFNRLIPEVLSVCTVQFKAVTDAIKMQKSEFYMEDDLVHLVPSCGAFITMNPGYLGRAELPEGLKALFRPITVVVPDLELICENILMAEGFVNAKMLARKFVTLYKLCKSLLSDQDHYDWGLRAIKSVLVVAGTFKRAEPEISEESLLFRALRDFNYPKIAQVDFGIFNGLLGDLFPSIEIPRKVDEKFEDIIVKTAIEDKLSPHPDFILKIVQLKELLEIRHCVFLMGPPAAGKSTTWKILAKSNDKIGQKTTCQDLDPKVVNTRDLYGYTNMKTKEWKNGLLSHYMQYFSEETTDGNPKWIILDGDLDANWIESMNSVMDDNKLLTLANNGRIVLKNYMKLLFEIRDLKFATPATVSRAGILYISDDKGYQRFCYIDSWLKKFQKEFNVKIEFLQSLFKKYVENIVDYMRKNCKFVVPISFFSMTTILCKMLWSQIKTNYENMKQGFDQVEKIEVLDNIKTESLFVMCAVWAYGGCLSEKDNKDYRKEFSGFWKNEFKSIKFPSKGTVFDYFVDIEASNFSLKEWKSIVQTIEYDPSIPMGNITVPIPETISIQQLSKFLIQEKAPILYIGQAGCGKTQLIKGLLKDIRKTMPNDYYFSTINFNFYTDSDYLQTMMENELVKQGNRYGPKKGSKINLIYFIDDLNMPQLDPYNTQTAIALLRQHVDYSHWYDISKAVPWLKEVINTQVLAAMNPTSGSFYVNPRYQRHFWTVAINIPEQHSQIMIYETFLKGHFKKFKSIIQDMSVPLIKAAIILHDKVQSGFKKTAINFHYEFTIRHLSSIFQGILFSQPAQFHDPEKIVKLWIHESERVYSDRLVKIEDIKNFKDILADVVKKNFAKFALSKYFNNNPETLIFTNFPNGYQNEKNYDIVSFQDAEKHVLEALRDYNENLVEMNLVLFDDAIKNVCKITRIVSSPSGHALLVGVGGSGKQSLTKLAAFICELTPFSMTVSANYSMNQLKEDLLSLYTKSGLKDEGILFLITDGHITQERFLVYINDLLSSGEVADLYTEEDKMNIINTVRPKVKSLGTGDSPDDCWAYFIGKVKQNLHVTLCFSPVGDIFRSRARRFPALVNCTKINWFQPWPKEALRNVAKEFLSEIDLGDDVIRTAVIDFMPFSFDIANKAAVKIFEQERRYVYTTPKSFLELLELFKLMLEKKRQQLEGEKDIYELGLVKLEETEKKVAELGEDLKIISVDVEKKKEEADKVAEVVGREKAKVEEESNKAKIEEDSCIKIKQDVELQQASCEEDVKKLTPLVENAKENLNSLDIKEIQFLKAVQQPPAGVDKVFFCIMYMFSGVPGYDNEIELNKQKLPKNLDWKNGCLKLMKEPKKLIDQLLGFHNLINENKVPAQNFAKIKPYFDDELFKNPELMVKKSKAAANILNFISCMVDYYDAMTQMIPKREALESANNELERANTKLEKVKAEVAQLEADLAILVEKFDKATYEKNCAIAEANKCQKKLDLAQRLVGALSSEKGRWGDSIKSLSSELDNVIGDVLLAAGFISYTGPFTKTFREHIISHEFAPFIHKKNIPKSSNSNPVQLLVDEATKAEWNNQGLPSDTVSIENGVILTNSERYPLLIDPQLQGITWILEKEKVNNLKVMRIGGKTMIIELERAIENGTPVLLENLDDQIDAIIMPIIARNTFKRLGKKYLKFGGKDLLLNPNFVLYLQTKLSNPHYPPEVQAEAALINFTVTEEGLGDQLLTLVVQKERPDLASMKIDLIHQQNEFKIKLKELEKGLLEKLKNLEGEFLEDTTLIENLENSQKFSLEIRDKVEVAKVTEVDINTASEFYRPAAVRGALVFFLMNDLYKMNSFYMYSLEAFLDVIIRAIKIIAEEYDEKERQLQAEKNEEEQDGEQQQQESKEQVEENGTKPIEHKLSETEVRERVEKLCESITYQCFDYVRKGLFESHKIIFSTLVCLKVLEKQGLLNSEEIKHLIQGKQLSNYPNMPETVKGYLTETIWKDCKSLDYISELSDLCENFDHDHLHWRKWFSEEKVEEIELPKKYKDVSEFHKLMVIKMMRPDRVSSALGIFVAKYLGEKYIEQKPFNMKETFAITSCITPVFFVLFPGVDPTTDVENIGKEKGKSLQEQTLFNLSMGQGQEEKAILLLKQCAQNGNWIFLQNVHLMQSWLKDFERALENVIKDAHEDFRVFISSEPPPLPTMKIIPESILQKCIKISNQAPQDLKANMYRALSHFSQDNVNLSSKKNEYKNILFALCYFHSVVLGRRKFGTQGWARTYNFNDGDLTICADVLHNYLEKYDQVPYEDLRYIYGEIMYGGHITDDWDRRTNNTYLKVLVRPELLNNMNLIPAHTPIYRILDPNKHDFEDYVNYIEKLPKESPQMFGMHSNAEINYLTNQCESIFVMIVDVQGGHSSSGGSEDYNIKDQVVKLQNSIPDGFSLIKIQEKIEQKGQSIPSPYDIFCLQECEKMNQLLQEITSSLEELYMGLDGALNMTDAMEVLTHSLDLNRVPDKWGSYYPSKKHLTNWFKDLQQRCNQLQEWSEELHLPKSVCLSYLFNPMSFLTAIMQLTARAKLLPLDNMTLETIVTSIVDHNTIQNYPEEGAYIHGLFLEGASWELAENDGYLVDQKLKELHPILPVINVVAIEIEKKDLVGKYKCPVYYTTQRGPTYVFTADLKMESYDFDDSKWILSGVAGILNDDN